MEKNLKELDFFDMKLLADKQGTFYVRDGDMFIYHGADKITIDPNHSGTIDPLNLKEKMGVAPTNFKIGDFDVERVNPTKDLKANGYFHLWQRDEYFVFYFITEAHKKYKGTVYVLRAGNALDSLGDDDEK